MQTTLDKLLGGRFEVEQPAKGYRIAVDTLLLAAAIQAQEAQRAIEFGCGVGGVMLALATRVPGLSLTGLELQLDMAALCRTNIERNHFQDRLSVEQADVASLPEGFFNAFDHVAMNPPYHDHKTHSLSANRTKRLAHAETDAADLSVWIEQGAKVLKENGSLWMIHRADRMEEILDNLSKFFTQIDIKPILARDGVAPKRIVVHAKKNVLRQTTTLPPFILYGEDNRYNEAAEAVLRHAQALPF
ncbi:MAG: tRNA1(Val) (adenine(37)-N6)-methyltransferase [Bdellovibrionales bacterium]